MNTVTPRVFIAATRQNDGKTTTSLGLSGALRREYENVGFIKPVGQRLVEIAEQKIDEDTVLMNQVYHLNCPLESMSPIAIEPDFTKKYLESSNLEILEKKILTAFDRASWEKNFVVCEGSGHAGVGSVFDLSNARVAKLLNAKVILVTRGGIGKPIDEVCLNKALFEKEGVEIIGVIVNKVLPQKMEFIKEFCRKGLKRQGLDLLGALPLLPMLTYPGMDLIAEELKAEPLNRSSQARNLVSQVVIGAMGPGRALDILKEGALLIAPTDRMDLIIAAGEGIKNGRITSMAGMILTGKIPPEKETLKLIKELPFPSLYSKKDSYEVASLVHDLIVKIRPSDTEKIRLIQDLFIKHVDVDKIIEAVDP